MSEAMQMQMLLGMMREVKDTLEALRTNGCNKAMMHGVLEKNNEVLFEKVDALEKANKDTKLISVLNNPWPWLFASIAVFSPNAVAIIEMLKGVAK